MPRDNNDMPIFDEQLGSIETPQNDRIFQLQQQLNDLNLNCKNPMLDLPDLEGSP